MNMQLSLGRNELRRLAKMVINDLDTADKQALDEILWRLAKQANICDDEGNLKLVGETLLDNTL